MLTGIVAVVIGLGLMVLVHEWGHFVVARLFGVRVDVFSIGFGPRIWGVKRGTTDYRLSILPLGGYVRMAGDNPAEERRGDADEFLSKPRWQRALIALAGPTTNFLMAIVLTAALYVYGGQEPQYADEPATIGAVVKDSPAEKAGIQPGDRVVGIGDVKNPTWDRLIWELGLSVPGHPEALTLDRAGQKVSVTVASDQDPFASVGYPSEPVMIGGVGGVRIADGTLDHPAAALQAGDQIVAVNGQKLQSPYQLSEMMQGSDGHKVEMDILRNGQTVHADIQPTWGDPGDGKVRWSIGITYRFASSRRTNSVGRAVVKATEFHVIFAEKVIYLVGGMFTGKVSLKQVQGPVGIVQASSQAAKRGFGDVVYLMALVSLQLGILNLLPIPILDGGHIVMLGIESVLRHDLSLKIKERIVTVGMAFLLLVFLMVMYNDVHRFFPGR